MLSRAEEQKKEIETIRERNISVKLSDADCERIAKLCGEYDLKVGELLGNFIMDLVGGTYTNKMAPYRKTLLYKPNDTQMVTVRIVAGMTKRNKDGRWEPDKAGWYIYCNNREVVSADKSQLTTWYTADGVKFHNKYAGFRGMVFFNSVNPELLPWNTSKNNVDASSDVFQYALAEIKNAFDKVKKEFDKLEELEEDQKEKITKILQGMQSMPINFYSSESMPHSYVEKSIDKIIEDEQREPLVTVNYKVEKRIMDKAKEALHVTSAKEVGKETFNFYCMMEGIDNA